jgi:beta-N-acetylhexosaminidase
MDEQTRRLAYAVLMPGFSGTSAPPWLLDALADGLGGVCYFGHNLISPEQTAALSAQIHAAGSVVIAVDEEGGVVTRLHVRDGSPHVGAAVLGRADDLGLTRAVARGIARDVRAAGVDLALAPVVDINSDPANPVIGVRSFGAEAGLVGRHAAAFVTAMQDEGIAACAKHFPGHGDTKVDSHAGLPVVDVDLATLHARELVPFAAAVDAGVRCVMTSHIVFPALDGEMATVSPAVLGLLRDDLGFEGVIVSDAVDMRAVSETIGFAEGAVRALAAGVDLVCLGNPANPADPADPAGPRAGEVPPDEEEFRQAADAVLRAVEAGRLPLARLEQAAARVRALSDWSRLGRAAANPNDTAAARALYVRGKVAGALKGPLGGRHRPVESGEPQPRGERLVQRGDVAVPDERLGRRRPHLVPVQQLHHPLHPVPAAGAQHGRGRRVAPGVLEVVGPGLVGPGEVAGGMRVQHVRGHHRLQAPAAQDVQARDEPFARHGPAGRHDRDPVARAQPPGPYQRGDGHPDHVRDPSHPFGHVVSSSAGTPAGVKPNTWP